MTDRFSQDGLHFCVDKWLWNLRRQEREAIDGSLPPLLLQHYLRWGAVPLLCPLGGGAGVGPLPSSCPGKCGQLTALVTWDDGCGQLPSVSVTTHQNTSGALYAALTSHSENLTNGGGTSSICSDHCSRRHERKKGWPFHLPAYRPGASVSHKNLLEIGKFSASPPIYRIRTSGGVGTAVCFHKSSGSYWGTLELGSGYC